MGRMTLGRTNIILAITIMALVTTGCSTVKMRPVTSEAKDLSVSLKLDKTSQGFILSVKNQTNSEVIIDWENTKYIHPKGGTEGGFTYGTETTPEEGARAVGNIIINAQESVTRHIYPVATRYCGRSCKWQFLPPGTSGVYLVYRVTGENREGRMRITGDLVK